jgi:hypothetical protein
MCLGDSSVARTRIRRIPEESEKGHERSRSKREIEALSASVDPKIADSTAAPRSSIGLVPIDLIETAARIFQRQVCSAHRLPATRKRFTWGGCAESRVSHMMACAALPLAIRSRPLPPHHNNGLLRLAIPEIQDGSAQSKLLGCRYSAVSASISATIGCGRAPAFLARDGLAEEPWQPPHQENANT